MDDLAPNWSPVMSQLGLFSKECLRPILSIMQIGLEIKVVGGGWHFQKENFGEFPFLSVSRYKPDSLHQLARSVWGRKVASKGFLSLRRVLHGGCEAIKVDLLCFAPARDENTLWARREGSWDSQKDYLELESWDVPRTKSLLTCSSYEQPLIKWWSFMSCGIHWAPAL